MQEEVRIIGAPYEAGAYRIGRLVVIVAPVLSEVELRSPMPIKIVGESGTESLGLIWQIEGSGVVGVAADGGDCAARMQPLISHKQVIFRIRVALRKGTTRDE